MSQFTYLLKTGIITFSEYEIAFRFKDEAEYLLSTFIRYAGASSKELVKMNDIEYMLAVR
jgi:hypothetical protein